MKQWPPNGLIVECQNGVCTNIHIFRIVKFDMFFVSDLGRGFPYAIVLHKFRLAIFDRTIDQDVATQNKGDVVTEFVRLGFEFVIEI